MEADMVASHWNPSPTFWQGRRVLVTGHTGFKGGWLCCMLSLLQARVYGYSLDEKPSPNAHDVWKQHYRTEADLTSADVVDQDKFAAYMGGAEPEIVIHLAAQPLVIDSYRDPLGTVRTNILGTASVLDACRRQESVSAIVVVTSDKVYREAGSRAYVETDILGGSDVYSASKACCELLTDSFRQSYYSPGSNGGTARIATVRAGNVVGGGDWAENRLIPDLVRAHRAGLPCLIRNPVATRPWQHVLEPLLGYLCVAEGLVTGQVGGGAWNFGPSRDQIHSVREVAEAVRRSLGGPRVTFGEVPEAAAREMENLRIDNSKAREHLGWGPRLDFEKAIEWTCRWYQASEALTSREVTEGQITEYLHM